MDAASQACSSETSSYMVYRVELNPGYWIQHCRHGALQQYKQRVSVHLSLLFSPHACCMQADERCKFHIPYSVFPSVGYCCLLPSGSPFSKHPTVCPSSGFAPETKSGDEAASVDYGVVQPASGSVRLAFPIHYSGFRAEDTLASQALSSLPTRPNVSITSSQLAVRHAGHKPARILWKARFLPVPGKKAAS